MTPEQAPNPLIHLLPLSIIFIFYFLIFKPQKDKETQRKKTLSILKKNDEVVTAGGIHGTIVNVKETTVIVRVDDSVKLEVDKEAITNITKKSND